MTGGHDDEKEIRETDMQGDTAATSHTTADDERPRLLGIYPQHQRGQESLGINFTKCSDNHAIMFNN